MTWSQPQNGTDPAAERQSHSGNRPTAQQRSSSRGAAIVGSQGRQPLESRDHKTHSPGGATVTTKCQRRSSLRDSNNGMTTVPGADAPGYRRRSLRDENNLQPKFNQPMKTINR